MPDIYAGTSDAAMRMDNESTWAGARDVATAETINTTQSKNNAAIKIAVNAGENQYDVYRYFLAFDTSGVTATPDSATLKIHGFSYNNAQLIIVKVHASATGDSGTDYVAGDFDKVTSTAYSSEVTSWSASAYNEITLNSTALSDMASLDEFKIAVIDHDFDYSDSAPPASTTRRTGMYFANQSGTSKDPLISYVEGSAGYGHSVSGLASDNIATVIGVATANIAKVSGV